MWLGHPEQSPSLLREEAQREVQEDFERRAEEGRVAEKYGRAHPGWFRRLFRRRPKSA